MSSTASCSVHIPILTTERLTLRGHCLADFPACAALWADPEVTRYIGGRPSTEEEVWARFLRYVGHWTLLGFGFWVVEEKSTGRLLGEVGFADFKRAITPSFGDAPEAGWVLAPGAHGKGFATEAIRAALAWATSHFGGGRSVCMIDPGNQVSLRVAAKCGFKEFARTLYKGDEVILCAAQLGP